MSELTNNMADEELEQEEQVQERQPFIVDNDQKAEWCLKQIRQKKAEIEKWKAHYDRLFETIRKDCEADILHWEASLKGYFLQQSDDGFTKSTKTQESYTLPTGKLVLKKQEPEYVRDDDALVKWCEANAPEFVKVKKTPDWKGLKSTLTLSEDNKLYAVDEDGVVHDVDGVTVNVRPDIFNVEVK